MTSEILPKQGFFDCMPQFGIYGLGDALKGEWENEAQEIIDLGLLPRASTIITGPFDALRDSTRAACVFQRLSHRADLHGQSGKNLKTKWVEKDVFSDSLAEWRGF